MKRSGTSLSTPRKKSRTSVVNVRPVSSAQAEMAAIKRNQAKIARDVRKLKAVRELHYHDEVRASAIIPYDTNNTTILCDPPQGDGINERVGDKLSPTLVDIRGVIYGKASGESTVRLLLVQSKQGFIPSGVAATGGSSVWNAAASGAAPVSQFTWDNREHYVVLHDQVFDIPVGDQTYGSQAFHIKKKISRPIRYDAGTTTYETGGLYFILTSSRAAVDGNVPSLQFRARTFFYDA